MKTIEEKPEKGSDPRAVRHILVIVASMLAIALCTVSILFAVYAADNGDARYRDARHLLELVRSDPAVMLPRLNSIDGASILLRDSLEAVKGRSRKEFNAFVFMTSSNLMGEDQVAFITGRNSLGGYNAETLGYLNACLSLAGVDELPWPKNKDGRPYDGASETRYDEAFLEVLHENEGK